MSALRIAVIGGSAAGPKAAAKARRMDQHAEITIVQKAGDLSMASCGYPYCVGGTFNDRRQLICTPAGVVRDPDFFRNAKAITALTRTEAVAIDRGARRVTCRHLATGEERVLSCDRLVIATGDVPIRRPVPGIDLDGITTLQSMEDADRLRRVRDEGEVRDAVVIGGGLIGVETCEALQLAGIRITVVEMRPQILSFLDPEMARLVENHMRASGARVVTGNPVAAFLDRNGRVAGVRLRDGTELPCELAVVATGVRPNSRRAAEAGLAIGERGGIRVDRHLRTSDPDVYAAGDCIEVPHLVTGRPVHVPRGDLANLQGRVVGQNAVHPGSAEFPGTLQTGVCKVFESAAGSTGLSERAAREAGFDAVSVITAGADRPDYMGAKPLVMKMVAERGTGRLLGVQCAGPGDASKRLAEAAMALHGRLTVADLSVADLPCAPPLSPPVDSLVTAAHVLGNKMAGRMQGISAAEVKAKVDAGQAPFILDARGPDEYDAMRLGIGESLIPLGAIRRRLSELPAGRDREIVCYCRISLRGYEAAGILEGQGYTNVKVMEGGLLAWPFPREK